METMHHTTGWRWRRQLATAAEAVGRRAIENEAQVSSGLPILNAPPLARGSWHERCMIGGRAMAARLPPCPRLGGARWRRRSPPAAGLSLLAEGVGAEILLMSID